MAVFACGKMPHYMALLSESGSVRDLLPHFNLVLHANPFLAKCYGI